MISKASNDTISDTSPIVVWLILTINYSPFIAMDIWDGTIIIITSFSDNYVGSKPLNRPTRREQLDYLDSQVGLDLRVNLVRPNCLN